MSSRRITKWKDRLRGRKDDSVEGTQQDQAMAVLPFRSPQPEITRPEISSRAEPLVKVDEGEVEKEKDASIDPPSLWDRAYDSIRTEDPKLVTLYENILSQSLTGDPDPPINNIIEQKDWRKRRAQMYQVLKSGLEKNKKVAKVEEKVNFAFSVILSFKSAVDLGLKSNPAGAAAWAGVCIALQLALNPLTEAKTAREGVSSVILRMKWYSSLSTLLLERSPDDPNEAFEELRKVLAECIYELYKKLFKYIFECVCALDRNPALTFLRNAIKLDDWNGKLDDVSKAEKRVNSAASEYGARQTNSYLSILVNMQQSSADQQLMQTLWVADMTAEIESLQNRKDHLLEDSYKWILENQTYRDFTNWDTEAGRLLWVRGDPGKGKTMLMMGIIRELTHRLQTHVDEPFISYFFCQGTNNRLNTATAILRGLVWMLIRQQRSLIRHLHDVFKDAGHSTFTDQASFYSLKRAFENILADEDRCKVYLVVDALDECRVEEPGQSQLLDLISCSSEKYSNIKWLVSSRNIPEIETHLERTVSGPQLSLELNATSVRAAVESYINYKVDLLNDKYIKGLRKRHTPSVAKQLQELQGALKSQLLDKAKGTFLWVSLALKEIEGCGADTVLYRIKQLPPSLDSLYSEILSRMRRNDDLEHCQRVLLVMVSAYRPLRLCELAVLASLSDLAVHEDIVHHCGLLTIKKVDEGNEDESMVYFIHQSARDFLVKPPELNTTLQEIFPQTYQQGHREIFSQSLMEAKHLHRDMYNLRYPDATLEDAARARSNPNDLTRLQYSCVYWIDHFCEYGCEKNDEDEASDLQAIHTFMTKHFIYWLEAMALLDELPNAILSFRRLLQKLQLSSSLAVDSQPELVPLLKDAERFVLFSRHMIDKAPLQIYGAALVFCPTESPIRKLFWKSRFLFLERIVGGPGTWDPCLQTFEVPKKEWVRSATFSGDGETIAFSTQRGIYIRDTVTGSLKLFISTESGRNDGIIIALAFSHNGQYLASGTSFDTSSDTSSGESFGVDIWDTTTGKLCQTFDGIPRKMHHDDSFLEFFRDDGQIIISPDAKTFSVIDLLTREVVQQLAYPSRVLCVSYSPDGSHILAISEDGKVRAWDSNINELQEISSFSGESYGSRFQCARFSVDLKRAAIIYRNESNQIESQIVDLRTGPWGTDMFSLNLQSSVAVSADLLKVLFLDSSGEMVAWDSSRHVEPDMMSSTPMAQTSNGGILATIDSNISDTSSTVKIWDRNLLSSDSHNRETIPRFSTLPRLTVSPHGLLLAATYDTGTDLWDLGNARLLKVLSRHERDLSWNKPVFSPDSKLLVTNPDGRLCLWDTASGELVWEVSHEFICEAPAFSLDSQRLATASYRSGLDRVKNCILHTFDATTGQHLELPKRTNGHFIDIPPYSRVSFSVDIRMIQVFEDDVASIYDVTSGEKVARITRKDNPVEDPDEDQGWHQANKIAGLVYSATRAMAAFKHESTIYVLDQGQAWFNRPLHWSHQFETCRISSHLAFSEDRQYLFAGAELFSLIKPPELFDFSDNWVWCNGQKVLFLPPDYRMEWVSQSDHHRILAPRSAGPMILQFSEGGYDFGS